MTACTKTVRIALAAGMVFLTAAYCGKAPEEKPDKGRQPMKEHTNIGALFPAVTAKNLEGTMATVPDDARGKVTLVAVAFLQQNQGQLDSWLNPFVETFGSRDDVTFYEIPMISSGYIFMKPMIDMGMRGGLPQFKHKHVVTMYGDVRRYTDILGIDPRYGHAFLLDREGAVRWQGRGYATPEALRDLVDTAEKLSAAQ